MNPEPLAITKQWFPISDLKFCEGVRDAINRDPNRRAVVKKKGLRCMVVDYSRPIRQETYNKTNTYNIIIGWEPMEATKTGG